MNIWWMILIIMLCMVFREFIFNAVFILLGAIVLGWVVVYYAIATWWFKKTWPKKRLKILRAAQKKYDERQANEHSKTS